MSRQDGLAAFYNYIAASANLLRFLCLLQRASLAGVCLATFHTVQFRNSLAAGQAGE
jgi:hypothetical protein